MIFTPAGPAGGGSIDEILPRKNVLVRPAIANADQLLIVVSASKPAVDYSLVDKLLIYALHSGLPSAIGINKADQADEEQCQQIAKRYEKSGAQVLVFSAQTGYGMEQVRKLLEGKCTCLAGQSAVGKSSLLNALCPELRLETGGMSRKTSRGRHTTRHSELLYLHELNAVVADTPGFSILEALELEPEELRDCYPEFYGKNCRFDSCLHYKEPGCEVIKSVQEGEIPAARYEGYLKILMELFERRETRYD